MKLAWIENLVKEGSVRREVAEDIYDDMLKLANASDAEMHELAHKVAPFVTAGLFTAGSWLMGKHMDNKHMETANGHMKTIMESLGNDPQKVDKAKARFQEIASIAPSITTNLPLMDKLVKQRLNDGLSAEDAQRLALLEAQKQSTLKKTLLNPFGKHAEAGDMAADIMIMAKEAGWRDVFKDKRLTDFAKVFGLMTAVPLAVAGVGGVAKTVMVYKSRKELEQKLEDSFNQALERSDPNKEDLRNNREKARQAFQALVHFAPQVAVQPDAARAFMSKIVSYDQGLQSTDVRDLTEIQKNISAASPQNPFFTGFSGTSTALGLSGIASKATEKALEPFLPRRVTDDKKNVHYKWVDEGILDSNNEGVM